MALLSNNAAALRHYLDLCPIVDICDTDETIISDGDGQVEELHGRIILWCDDLSSRNHHHRCRHEARAALGVSVTNY